MQGFVQLLPFVPKSETAETFGELVAGCIPHVARRPYWTRAGDALEEWIVPQLDERPQRAMSLYRLFHAQRPRATAKIRGPRMDEIIRKGVESPTAHPDLLGLLEALADRHDIDDYQAIYEQLRGGRAPTGPSQ
jgi:hypothetical protein